ncbi:hypothetical protein MuYL_1758 [Mucilaginibacter xinganensis]|uniref:Uncharacterized protein n=1 Tax=Mucilaginibacter xinganensis TaxID=1234841 RepID=A0A223NVF4_9SPHI|nr:hypothetical protein MuYL_1758 [Mucilaginibacter xinganensis]
MVQKWNFGQPGFMKIKHRLEDNYTGCILIRDRQDKYLIFGEITSAISSFLILIKFIQ